jgi:hypothetical protein
MIPSKQEAVHTSQETRGLFSNTLFSNNGDVLQMFKKCTHFQKGSTSKSEQYQKLYSSVNIGEGRVFFFIFTTVNLLSLLRDLVNVTLASIAKSKSDAPSVFEVGLLLTRIIDLMTPLTPFNTLTS